MLDTQPLLLLLCLCNCLVQTSDAWQSPAVLPPATRSSSSGSSCCTRKKRSRAAIGSCCRKHGLQRSAVAELACVETSTDHHAFIPQRPKHPQHEQQQQQQQQHLQHSFGDDDETTLNVPDALDSELRIQTLDHLADTLFTDEVQAIRALGHEGQWAAVLTALQAVQAPDLVLYNAAISAVSKSGRWREALDLMDTMRANSVAPDVVTYSCAISAAAKGGELKRALTLLGEMGTQGVAPNVVTYNTALTGCALQ
jgi:pentatricopeptide repeat protein